MLPRNIDLTANGDFGGGNINSWFLPFDTEIISDAWDDGYMSLDQYEQLVKWENIFGRRRHINERRKLFEFDIQTKREINDSQFVCPRCGKVIRSPWNRIYGLCRSCHFTLESDSYSRTPWRPLRIVFNSASRDLFDLR